MSRVLIHSKHPRPCWQERTHGFTYEDKDLTPDGIQQLKLRAGFGGRARIVLKGKGVLLDDPAIPVTFPVTVQLLNSDGVCWETVYSTASKNTAGPRNGPTRAPLSPAIAPFRVRERTDGVAEPEPGIGVLSVP